MALTSTFITAYGTTTLVISDGGSAQTFDVSSIGQLTYDFDQTPDSVSIDRVQALYSYINVSAPNFNTARTDLWERLRTASLTGDIPCTLTIGGFEFKFRLRNNDLSFNERTRMIDMTLIPLIIEGVTAGQVFGALEAQGKMEATSIGGFGLSPTASRPTPPALNSCSVRDFIEQSMPLVFGNSYDNIYLSAKANIGDGYPDEIYGKAGAGQVGFVMVDMPELNPQTGSPLFAGSEEGANQVLISGTVTYQSGIQPDTLAIFYFGTEFSSINIGDIVFVNDVRIGVVTSKSFGFILVVNTSPAANPGQFPPEVVGGRLSLLRPILPNQIPALQHLKDLAGIEGAFFGTGFSRNFYVNRIRIADAPIVTLDYPKITDFKPDTFNLALGSSFVAQRADGRRNGPELIGQWPLALQEGQQTLVYSGIPNLREFESITTGNPNGTKGLQIGMSPGYPALNKAKRLSVMTATPSVSNDDLLENSLTRTGLTAYFQALNNTTNGIVVEFTILGAFSLKPWELFQFDTQAPEKYRNRQYRITSIAYDIINDTATVRGYQVSELTTPVFTGGLSSVTGINAEFGTGLLPTGLKTATQTAIAENDSRVANAVFRTAQALSGTFSEFFVVPYGTLPQSVIDEGFIGFAGYSIKIVNPFTLQTLDAVLETDLRVGAQRIRINAVATDDFYPAGSYIYLSQAQVLSGIITGELSQRLFAQATSIGTLLANVNGPVNSLSVLLNTRVRKGQDLQVKGYIGIIGAPNPTYYFTSRADYDAGVRTMDIRDEDNNAVSIFAKAGTEIIGNPVTTQAELNISPGEIAFGVDSEGEAMSLGVIDGSAPIAQGDTVTQIVIATLLIDILAGTEIVVSSWNGSQKFFVTADTAPNSPAVVPVQSTTALYNYPPGSEVKESGESSSSRITLNADSIVLRVDSNGNVASINLRGDVDSSGSVIDISANQVKINGIEFNAGTMSNVGDIKTSNYTAGTAGWKIDGDGSAEFNDVVVRGTVIGGSGALRYELDPTTGVTLGDPTVYGSSLSANELKMETLVGSDPNVPTAIVKGDELTISYGNMLFQFVATGTNTAELIATAQKINFANLPTSDTGLSVGDLWRDGNDVKVKT